MRTLGLGWRAPISHYRAHVHGRRSRAHAHFEMGTRHVLRLLIALSMTMFLAPPTLACGPDTDCVIDDRTYRIRMPEGHDGEAKIGAIIYAHGYRGTSEGVMRNASLGDLASELGVALIAAKTLGDDWSIPGVPSHSKNDAIDELAYFDRVIEDASNRFPIDRQRLMATGFSAGGMMVWNLICHRSEAFAAFAPIAGTFWAPEPEACTGPPASVVHIHGDADPIVPLEGRPIADTAQGDVFKVLDMYRGYGGYGAPSSDEVDGLRCENSVNGDGDLLNFCLFSGGHSFETRFVRHAWDAFVDAGRL